ncbi:hypothetical protein GCM10011581_19180 [Saccharopolyspora subtropica]|uniref:Uncharacterized protein n=1 Tax=Saccharopolyspora thermophila TaxID=89367 RepID=A0A917NBV5_9PSEU|nr:hypothetical protein [Saccharopolyspora subtropica]GGI81878.1 hypothetical protein GCM10011581_19180 [Saccharopolyspora subtropica]
MDVFVWGAVSPDHAVRALRALRGFQVLDGPVGPADVVGVRDGVLVELRHSDPGGLLVRFEDGATPGRASIAAHSFLWMITRRPWVEEAVLTGAGAEPLRFHRGRIHRMTPLGAGWPDD